MTNKQCSHPADRLQSGVFARGIWVPPVCLDCGESIVPDVEVTITVEADNV